MSRWIVVNIGCIECGVSSAIVGLYDSQERAADVAAKLDDRMSWREGGQNSYEVFALPETINETALEYRGASEQQP